MKGEAHGKHWKTGSAASGGTVERAHSTNKGTGGTVTVTFTTALPVVTRDYTIPDAGIRAGEIIGYRAWYKKGIGLCSMNVHYLWTPGPQIIRSRPVRNAGFHAFKAIQQAQDHYSFARLGGSAVFGRVAMWGEVIEHERGYRAEYARIVSLDKIMYYGRAWPGMSWIKGRRELNMLRKAYGVG